MKRGGPLKRTALKAKSWLTRGKPLRKRGARVIRRAPSRKDFIRVVIERAKGRCERCRKRARLHPHHLLPVGRGGSEDPSNGRALCFKCHIIDVHGKQGDDWRNWLLPGGAA